MTELNILRAALTKIHEKSYTTVNAYFAWEIANSAFAQIAKLDPQAGADAPGGQHDRLTPEEREQIETARAFKNKSREEGWLIAILDRHFPPPAAPQEPGQ